MDMLTALVELMVVGLFAAACLRNCASVAFGTRLRRGFAPAWGTRGEFLMIRLQKRRTPGLPGYSCPAVSAVSRFAGKTRRDGER